MTLAVGVGVATLAAVGALPAAPRRAWPALAALAGFRSGPRSRCSGRRHPTPPCRAVARTTLLALAFGVGATCAARPRAALGLAVAIGAGGAATALVVLWHLLTGDPRRSWPGACRSP